MTKEFQIANAETAARQSNRHLLFEICHHFVIMVSSFVIWILILAIRLYQLTISPALIFLFGQTAGCRFTPTCSQYALDAIREHGAVAGSWLAGKRICRCHPFGKCGHEPVPKKEFGIQNPELGI